MAEELRLQVQETDELQKSKRTLEEENKKLRREVQVCSAHALPTLGSIAHSLRSAARPLVTLAPVP